MSEENIEKLSKEGYKCPKCGNVLRYLPPCPRCRTPIQIGMQPDLLTKINVILQENPEESILILSINGFLHVKFPEKTKKGKEICQFCGKTFKRLSAHKCDVAPMDDSEITIPEKEE